jgi:hypothetical protein
MVTVLKGRTDERRLKDDNCFSFCAYLHYTAATYRFALYTHQQQLHGSRGRSSKLEAMRGLVPCLDFGLTVCQLGCRSEGRGSISAGSVQILRYLAIVIRYVYMDTLSMLTLQSELVNVLAFDGHCL